MDDVAEGEFFQSRRMTTCSGEYDSFVLFFRAISCASILPDPSRCLAIYGDKYAPNQRPRKQWALEGICCMWHISLVYGEHVSCGLLVETLRTE